MQTLSPGSDFRSHRGDGIPYLNAHLKLRSTSRSFARFIPAVKMIWVFCFFLFFLLFPEGQSISVAAYTWKSTSLSPPSICLRSRRLQASQNNGKPENLENQ